jgi:hypothetical protein
MYFGRENNVFSGPKNLESLVVGRACGRNGNPAEDIHLDFHKNFKATDFPRGLLKRTGCAEDPHRSKLGFLLKKKFRFQ